ncbi:Hypothetical predicted protein [Podarcis lilfordi]|uniref:Uncharacterized protein n=1 Tax=Podarcis lilfordi TaxID=74358 RepID=A0AA35LL24_9SAUR|nr:Hypothetical predicted protein [Podarcis lilfordi]
MRKGCRSSSFLYAFMYIDDFYFLQNARHTPGSQPLWTGLLVLLSPKEEKMVNLNWGPSFRSWWRFSR